MKIDNNLKNIFDSLYDGILIIDKGRIGEDIKIFIRR